MTHPEGSLAGYVDGTLPSSERTAVDAHLAGCARCRDEIALAGQARMALSALPLESPPADVATRALQEAGLERAARADDGPPRWYRFAGIAAAAAAILFVLTLVLPRIGQHPSGGAEDRSTSKSGAQVVAGPQASGAPQTIEIQHTNYDSASLTSLSASYTTPGSGGAGAATSTMSPASGTPQQTTRALRCIVRSAPKEAGQLIRLIRARFQGSPAYLAVFLEGPGADQPADAVSIWVFSTSDCAILSFSHAQL